MIQNNLKKYREKRKMTMVALCEASGIRAVQEYLSIEHGKRAPGVYKALAISKALKTSVEKLWKI